MVLNMCLLSIYELATSSLVYQHVPHSNNNLGDSTYHSMVKRGIVMILLVLHPIMSPKYLHYVCCLFVFFYTPLFVLAENSPFLGKYPTISPCLLVIAVFNYPPFSRLFSDFGRKIPMSDD